MLYDKFGIKNAAIVVLLTMSLWLMGCKTTVDPGQPSITVSLPRAPAYYAACFAELTPAAEQGKPLTRGLVVRLIADLTRSDKRHTRCGKDLLVWYAKVRQSFAKG